MACDVVLKQGQNESTKRDHVDCQVLDLWAVPFEIFCAHVRTGRARAFESLICFSEVATSSKSGGVLQEGKLPAEQKKKAQRGRAGEPHLQAARMFSKARIQALVIIHCLADEARTTSCRGGLEHAFYEFRRKYLHLDCSLDLSERQRQPRVPRPRSVVLGVAEFVHLFVGTGQHPFDVAAIHERRPRCFLAMTQRTAERGVRVGNYICTHQPRASHNCCGDHLCLE